MCEAIGHNQSYYRANISEYNRANFAATRSNSMVLSYCRLKLIENDWEFSWPLGLGPHQKKEGRTCKQFSASKHNEFLYSLNFASCISFDSCILCYTYMVFLWQGVVHLKIWSSILVFVRIYKELGKWNVNNQSYEKYI